MQFVHPYFLIGLAAIAIPVIIHLFNFRKYKRILFTNVSFIKDIQLQTRKQSRLKHLIILALRILAIISLVFAFAQPFIPLTEQTKTSETGNTLSIYLDNSFSMEAQSGYGQLLEEGRKKAAEIAAAYKAGDKYQLLTNDFEGLHQRLVTKEEYLQMLERVNISPSVRKISEVVTRQKDLMQSMPSKNKTLYLVSDFQKSTTDLAAIPFDSSIQIVLVPIKANPSPNITIDSCWFTSPVHQTGKAVTLKVRVKNVSDQQYEKVPLKLLINKNQKAVASFDLPPYSSQELELAYTDMDAGIRYGKLEISDSPIVYDDAFFFSYEVTSNIPVLVIDKGTPNIFLSSLMKNDSAFQYTRQAEQNLDYSSFSNYSLIILDALPAISSGLAQELTRFVKDGGSLLVTPSLSMDAKSYASFLQQVGISSYGALKKNKQKVTTLALQHPIFQDVFDEVPEKMDLPMILQSYEIGGTSRSNRDVLISMQRGEAFLTVQTAGQGKIYLLASPLDLTSSNFPQHALFVPVIYKIALLSRPDVRLSYTIGISERIAYNKLITGGDQVIMIKQLDGAMEFIPGQAQDGQATGLLVQDQIKEAGHYQVLEGEKITAGLAFNYQRDESDVSAYSAAELKELCAKNGLTNISVLETSAKNLTESILELHAGIRLWKLFIILALVFLAAEVFILRFWK